jgi:hypothetical protein
MFYIGGIMDDDPARMTFRERTVWICTVTVIVCAAAYAGLMVSRLLSRPVAEISWVAPMLVTMGLAVAGSILLAIVLTVGAAVVRRDARAPDGPEVFSDVRDREIGRLGWRASLYVISAGFGATLVLAMLEAHTFWIGNTIFLFGTAGAVVEGTTKIRLYRRGF